jgi:hypothetical protein
MARGKLKRLDKEKFEDALNGYLNGKYIQLEAAKVAGCSRDTFLKYADMILRGEPIPNGVFWDD